MDDLISRRQVIDAIKERYYKYGRFAKIEELVWSIEKLPSAKKKGHWIDEETNYICSECHRGCWVNSDYCPWCGADMKGDRDE